MTSELLTDNTAGQSAETPDAAATDPEEAPGSCVCPPRGASPKHTSNPWKNFWLDLVTAVVFAASIGTGILLKWILPPAIRGGRGLTWLGERRHFWGDVHFWLAVALVVLVALHLVLHWKWICGCWRRFVGRRISPVAWGTLLGASSLIVLPFVIPVERSHGPGRGRGLTAAGARSERGAGHGLGRGRGPAAVDGRSDRGKGGGGLDVRRAGSARADDSHGLAERRGGRRRGF